MPVQNDAQTPKHLVIGQITKPHGVRGELRIDVTTDVPERYHDLETVLIAKNERKTPQEMEVESVRFHQGKALVKLTVPEIVKFMVWGPVALLALVTAARKVPVPELAKLLTV